MSRRIMFTPTLIKATLEIWFPPAEKKIIDAQNIYVGLDGCLYPHVFPYKGLWRFDGQVYYLPRSKQC